jgi:hypothetical protein
MPRFDYCEMDLQTRDRLNVLKSFGAEGWELVGVVGEKAILKKEMPDLPPHLAGKQQQYCSECANFPEKSRDAVAKCNRWGISVKGDGSGCETFSARSPVTEKAVVITMAVEPAKTPDDLSAWHWQPDTVVGQKRVEAITSQDSGLSAPSHKHRVVAILCKEGKVVRGKTDMVNGHFHSIVFVGMTEEADGHTHSFVVPAKVE